MEMVVAKRRVEGSDAQESFAFGFKVTPKAFQLMIAQLYKDRIAAFIRELATNAYEAHQMVGTESKPFDITIPTMVNPVFKIRDYGPGLSIEQVKNIYTMLFESTKADSNDMGGCFGLGSKSPFAYDDNIQFAVTSFFNGKKYMYSVYKNEIGFPHMDLMMTTDTIDQNGVEVSIPINKNDFRTVETKAREVYKWFNTTPNLVNSANKFKSAIPSLIGSSYKIFSEDIYSACAKMGNIIYPIDTKLCNLSGLNNSKIVLEFPIGALTPEPSREGLSYDRKTINAIEIAAKAAVSEMVATIQPQIDDCQDFFDACALGESLIVGTPILLSNITYKGERLTTNLGYMSSNYGEKKHINGGKMKSDRYSTSIRPRKDVSFYVIDRKCHHNMMIMSDINEKNAHNHTIFICDIAYNKQDLDEFCKSLRIDKSRVKPVSQIKYTPIKRTPSTGPSKKHVTKVMEFTYDMSRLDCWKDSDVDINVTNGLYVLVHNNYIVIDEVKNTLVHPKELDALIDFIGYKGKVYGVKKAAYEKVKSNAGWKNFLDKAKKDAYNLMSGVDVDSVRIATETFDNISLNSSGTVATFIEKVAVGTYKVTPSDIKNVVDTFNQLKALAKTDLSIFDKLNRIFFSNSVTTKSVAVSSIKSNTYSSQLDSLLKKYPMFNYFRSYSLTGGLMKELVEYVNLKG